MNAALKQRWQAMKQAMERHLPNGSRPPGFGGTSYWVKSPGLDANRLAEEAQAHGVLIEPGDVYFMQNQPPREYFRLGYSSIAVDKIEPGIALLSRLIQGQLDHG